MASDNFINICKEPANANRLATITKVSDSTILTQDDYIQDFTIDKGCYVDSSIIGTIYVEKINANLIGSYGINLENEDIKVQVGIKYDDHTTEYIDLGKYKVEKPKDEATNNYSTVIAYSDLLNKLDSTYECNLDFTIEKTFLDLYNDLCNNLGLISKTTSFTNDNLILKGNPFANGETNRMVLQSIEKASCTFAQINSETNEIELCWLSQNEEPDYTFDLNDYSTLNGGKIVYGPINSLVIKMSDVDDENVSISDDESIAQNGEHQLVISEDYLLYTPELRQQAINAIWNKVHNLTYVDCELETHYGKPFLKIGDKIRVYKDEENYFDTYVLTHQFKYDGSFYSKITSPVLTAQQVATKQDISLGELLKLTKIQVNKIAGEIIIIAQQSDENTENISQLSITSGDIALNISSLEENIKNTNQTIMNVQNGMTNTFTTSGGNNILRNTDLAESTYEGYIAWEGSLNKQDNIEAVNGISILLQDGSATQIDEVPNGQYVLGFNYNKLLELSTASILINGTEYVLEDYGSFEQVFEVTTNSINIEFKSDANDSYEIYDLRANVGSVLLPYSQNPNEVRSNTVTIGEGIRIKSDIQNTETTIDADGQRVINASTKEIVQQSTDEGGWFKKIVVEGDSEITGLSIKRVGRQVHINGL